MSTRTQWFLYSIVRLALFGGVFAVLMLLNVDLWIAGMAAAIIALCISFIFIRQPERKQRPEKPDVDAVAEDAVVDDATPVDATPEHPAVADDQVAGAAPVDATPTDQALERDRRSESKPE